MIQASLYIPIIYEDGEEWKNTATTTLNYSNYLPLLGCTAAFRCWRNDMNGNLTKRELSKLNQQQEAQKLPDRLETVKSSYKKIPSILFGVEVFVTKSESSSIFLVCFYRFFFQIELSSTFAVSRVFTSSLSSSSCKHWLQNSFE